MKIEVEVTYKVEVEIPKDVYQKLDDDGFDSEIDKYTRNHMDNAKLQKLHVMKENI